MGAIGEWLETGDKVASVAGAVIAVVALTLSVRWQRGRRPNPADGLAELLRAQRDDVRRHRYRFFGPHVPALSDLYVQQRVAGGHESGPVVAAADALRRHRHVLILGDAGAGKSTLITAFVGRLAGAAAHRPGRRRVGVVMHAADLLGRSLPEALAHACARDLKVAVPAAAFERPSGWKVFIDGVDEVRDGRERSEILWRLGDWFSGGSPYRFVVASRPLPEGELAALRRPGVGEYVLRPFDRSDLNAFARHWFQARHPNDPARAAESAARFLARVAGARLGPVARVPLLATIAAMVYEQDADMALPASRAALYERFVDHLMHGRGSLVAVREMAVGMLDGRDAAGAALAAWFTVDFPRNVAVLLNRLGTAVLRSPDLNLLSVADDHLLAQAGHRLTAAAPDGDRIVLELLLATGLFTRQRDRVAFAHQSFAEFLAARDAEGDFDPVAWRAAALDPTTRSQAGFAAARRPESDVLVAALAVNPDTAPVAGDLLADGVPVTDATRRAIVDALLAGHVIGETEAAPEALRVLRELAIDADVLDRIATAAADPDVPPWPRALLAETVAGVDRRTGVRLLRQAARTGDDAVVLWVANTLDRYGATLNLGVAEAGPRQGHRPLSTLARQVLAQQAADGQASETERIDAAGQLALAGELAPLRAMAQSPEVEPPARVRAASLLAEAGDPVTLHALAAPGSDTDLTIRYAAGAALFRIGDPAASAVLRDVVAARPDAPMAYGAAARLADLGDLGALTTLAGTTGQPPIQLAAARRLATLGDAGSLNRALRAGLAPAAEAEVLVALVRAGREDAVRRLGDLLRRHRFALAQRTGLLYLLAGHGDRVAREHLRRTARRWPGGRPAFQAAVALTALGDRDAAALLTRVAGQRRWGVRARLRAASGLARVQPTDGLPVLGALATPRPPSFLRRRRGRLQLRAAAVLGHSWGDLTALADTVTDRSVRPGLRAATVEVLARAADRNSQPPDYEIAWYVRTTNAIAPTPGEPAAPWGDQLTAIAVAEGEPPVVRVALASTGLIPVDIARRVLSAIATDRHTRPHARWSAIRALWNHNAETARSAMGELVRDPRIMRLARWLYLIEASHMLPDDDADTLRDRLGDDPSLRRLLALAHHRPEQVLSPTGGTPAIT